MQTVADPTHSVHGRVQLGHAPVKGNVPDGHIEVHYLLKLTKLIMLLTKRGLE